MKELEKGGEKYSDVLIETLWNVNGEEKPDPFGEVVVLIETLWNVNGKSGRPSG